MGDDVLLAVLAEHEPLRAAQPPQPIAERHAAEQRHERQRARAAIAMIPCVSVIDAAIATS